MQLWNGQKIILCVSPLEQKGERPLPPLRGQKTRSLVRKLMVCQSTYEQQVEYHELLSLIQKCKKIICQQDSSNKTGLD